MARRLVITRRQVPTEKSSDYDRRWLELQTAASAVPCHAWRYRSLSSPDSFIEFLEFAEGNDPRSDLGVLRATRALEKVAPGSPDDWQDATNPEGFA